MTIQVNGAPQEVAEGISVAQLLQQLSVQAEGVAVAINRNICPRSALDAQILQAGDQVELIRAVGGG